MERQMKGFGIRAVSLLAILGILFGYNRTLENREKEEAFVRLRAQVEAMEEYIQDMQAIQTAAAGRAQEDSPRKEDAQEEGLYADGEWEGEAQGFGGMISLKVIVEKGEITDIALISAEKEDPAYLSMAEAMLPAIVEAQSADVDTVTGATFSSTGIKNAVAQALEKAGR